MVKTILIVIAVILGIYFCFNNREKFSVTDYKERSIYRKDTPLNCEYKPISNTTLLKQLKPPSGPLPKNLPLTGEDTKKNCKKYISLNKGNCKNTITYNFCKKIIKEKDPNKFLRYYTPNTIFDVNCIFNNLCKISDKKEKNNLCKELCY